MPLRANIGISRKVADNNYGSRGASVNLEVELDSSLIQEPERLQERIRQVFRLAQVSVDEELTRQTTGNDGSNGHTAAATGNGNGNHSANGRTNGNSQPNGNGSAANSNGARNATNGHGASEKQLSYARQLAKSIQGLGIRRLETLAQKMFGKPLTAMSSMDASGLIDTLKSIKEGSMDLDSVLEGSGT